VLVDEEAPESAESGNGDTAATAPEAAPADATASS
jgi:hypothetical protein